MFLPQLLVLSRSFGVLFMVFLRLSYALFTPINFKSLPKRVAPEPGRNRNETDRCRHPAGKSGRGAERLTNIGVEGLTLTEVIGFGRQKGHSEFYRGCEYKVDFHPKLMLTIVAHEDQVDGILDAIMGGARTGRIGDGKIFVTSIDEVVRIRTGEIDKAAL